MFDRSSHHRPTFDAPVSFERPPANRRSVAAAALLSAAAWTVPAHANPAAVPYASRFAAGVGPEWSATNRTTLSTRAVALGPFGNAPVELTIAVAPGQPLALVFDLYCLDSWDGNDPRWGPDRFSVSIDGQVAFRETLGVWSGQSFVGWPTLWDLHLNSNRNYRDNGFQNIIIEFTPDREEVRIAFRGENLQSLSDESWALGRVRVLPLADADPLRPLFRETGRSIGFGVRSSDTVHRGAGAHWGDLNNDGFLDCVITGDRESTVLLNRAASSFDPVALHWDQLRVVGQGAMIDLNADGSLDFVGIPSTLNTIVGFTNDGQGALTPIDQPIMPTPTNCEGLGAIDLNRDGQPDLIALAGNNGNWAAIMPRRSTGEVAERPGSDFGFTDAGNGDYLSAADANGDGVLDVLYNLGPGILFGSMPGGSWERQTSGIAYNASNDFKAGAAWADYDNDGDFDVFVADQRSRVAGRLFRNDGGVFVDATADAGLSLVARQRSAAWGDFDNDGYLDLYIACHQQQAALFRNNGDGSFARVPADIAQCTTSGQSQHVVWVDYDNDGALDLSITNEDATTLLYRNLRPNDRYLLVHTDAPGCTITLLDEAGAFIAQRIVGNAMGFAGIEPVRAHFGGVDPNRTYTVEIRTPDGRLRRSSSVVPAATTARFGATIVNQMLDLSIAAQLRGGGAALVRWDEVQPERP